MESSGQFDIHLRDEKDESSWGVQVFRSITSDSARFVRTFLPPPNLPIFPALKESRQTLAGKTFNCIHKIQVSYNYGFS